MSKSTEKVICPTCGRRSRNPVIIKAILKFIHKASLTERSPMLEATVKPE